mmetsp:Transcript_43314/g.139622  ORF Transcript_43314/g.139622 Transcript_43314/m.139622 type:complete len:226 (+) Transcript_43314:592-1269(+)
MSRSKSFSGGSSGGSDSSADSSDAALRYEPGGSARSGAPASTARLTLRPRRPSLLTLSTMGPTNPPDACMSSSSAANGGDAGARSSPPPRASRSAARRPGTSRRSTTTLWESDGRITSRRSFHDPVLASCISTPFHRSTRSPSCSTSAAGEPGTSRSTTPSWQPRPSLPWRSSCIVSRSVFTCAAGDLTARQSVATKASMIRRGSRDSASRSRRPDTRTDTTGAA